MSRQIFVGTFSDGTERVLTTLRGERGLVAYEDAEAYLAKNVGAYFARLWVDARESKHKMRGIRWLSAAGGLVSRPDGNEPGISWLRYCSEAVEQCEFDTTVAELVKHSLNKREREIWREVRNGSRDVA